MFFVIVNERLLYLTKTKSYLVNIFDEGDEFSILNKYFSQQISEALNPHKKKNSLD